MHFPVLLIPTLFFVHILADTTGVMTDADAAIRIFFKNLVEESFHKKWFISMTGRRAGTGFDRITVHYCIMVFCYSKLLP